MFKFLNRTKVQCKHDHVIKRSFRSGAHIFLKVRMTKVFGLKRAHWCSKKAQWSSKNLTRAYWCSKLLKFSEKMSLRNVFVLKELSGRMTSTLGLKIGAWKGLKDVQQSSLMFKSAHRSSLVLQFFKTGSMVFKGQLQYKKGSLSLIGAQVTKKTKIHCKNEPVKCVCLKKSSQKHNFFFKIRCSKRA